MLEEGTVTLEPVSSNRSPQEWIWNPRRPAKSELCLTASKKQHKSSRKASKSTHSLPVTRSVTRGGSSCERHIPCEQTSHHPVQPVGVRKPVQKAWEKGLGMWLAQEEQSQINSPRKTKSHPERESAEKGSEVWSLKALATGDVDSWLVPLTAQQKPVSNSLLPYMSWILGSRFWGGCPLGISHSCRQRFVLAQE